MTTPDPDKVRRVRPRLPLQARKPEEPSGLVTPPGPRSVQVLAALALVIVAVGGVGALIFGVVVFGNDASALVSLVSIALGGVIALAGAASKEPPKPPEPPTGS